jgi:hypothetical protein
MSHQLTNWMGDTGFLHKLAVKIRRHNPVGDTLYVNAEVTRLFEEAESITQKSARPRLTTTGIYRCSRPASCGCRRGWRSKLKVYMNCAALSF